MGIHKSLEQTFFCLLFSTSQDLGTFNTFRLAIELAENELPWSKLQARFKVKYHIAMGFFPRAYSSIHDFSGWQMRRGRMNFETWFDSFQLWKLFKHVEVLNKTVVCAILPVSDDQLFEHHRIGKNQKTMMKTISGAVWACRWLLSLIDWLIDCFQAHKPAGK